MLAGGVAGVVIGGRQITPEHFAILHDIDQIPFLTCSLAAVAIVAAQMTTVLESRLVSSACYVVHAEARRADRTEVVLCCEIGSTRETQLAASNVGLLNPPIIVADRLAFDEHVSFVT